MMRKALEKTLTVVALLLAMLAAFAFSFSLDLLFGAWASVYSSNAYLPTITWWIIASVSLNVAIKITHQHVWLIFPFIGFAALAFFGAIVGAHPHSYGVAALLTLQSMKMWSETHPPT